MVVKICPVIDIFDRSNSKTVYLTRFNLLNQYVDSSLEKYIRFWPKIGKVFDGKKIIPDMTDYAFSDSNNGKIIILTLKNPETEKVKEFCDKIEQFIKKIDSCFSQIPDVYRVDLSSMTIAFNRNDFLKVQNIFANSEKKFELYC